MLYLSLRLCNGFSQAASIFVLENKNRNMKLVDFMQTFPDEESCENKLREYRKKHGVVAPNVDVKNITGRQTRSASSASTAIIGRV